MKIKTKQLSYDRVLAIPKPTHKRPNKPNILLTGLIRLLAIPDLLATRFKYTKIRMEEAGPGPYLILMNHSSFIDLKIVSKIFWPMPYNIVCTSDGFIGKNWLMRGIGCIPTQKFVTDISLIMDMLHSIRKLNTSILMYPEASYSFDGCATPLPRRLGMLIKKLDVPVITVITEGAFLRDPLYNGLQLRKTRVSAEVKCLLTREEIAEKPVEEIDALLDEAFTFDHFARQLETKTEIREKFRADGLNRILYRCAHCETEGQMIGKGTTLTCGHCGKTYEMDIYGQLKATEGETEFSHIPDWYNWQRACVRRELTDGTYKLDLDVDIGVMADYKAIYKVGSGRLVHDTNGFTLTGCDGQLAYTQPPTACYGLYADYYWYEIADVICIGNKDRLYYCFPKERDVVAKARMATEELYKMKQAEKHSKNMSFI